VKHYRHHYDLGSAGQVAYAAFFCFGVSGIMSLTFFKSDWGDRGLVMIGLMAMGAVGGVMLLLRARKLARVGNLFHDVFLDTPRQALRPGETVCLRLGLQPARSLEIDRVVFRFEQIESCHLEGEEVHAETYQIFEVKKKVKVGGKLETEKEHVVEGKLTLPGDAPATLSGQHHRIYCQIAVRIVGKGFSPVELTWPMEVAPRLDASILPPDNSGGDFAARVDFEGFHLILEQDEEAEVGGSLTGALMFDVQEAQPHPAITGVLIWTLEGGTPESFEVTRQEITPGGGFERGKNRIPLNLEIPADAPATYLGNLVTVRWTLHILIPGLAEAGDPAVLPVRVGMGRT
jgi:hypothetical protein